MGGPHAPNMVMWDMAAFFSFQKSCLHAQTLGLFEFPFWTSICLYPPMPCHYQRHLSCRWSKRAPCGYLIIVKRLGGPADRPVSSIFGFEHWFHRRGPNVHVSLEVRGEGSLSTLREHCIHNICLFTRTSVLITAKARKSCERGCRTVRVRHDASTVPYE